MDETSDFSENSEAAALLKDLLRMRGSRCKMCAAPLCGHETLMSLVAGYKDAPRCLSCLSELMGAGREEMRDHLFGYIKSRACRYAGWLWANREEGMEPTALPQCLWPSAGGARKEDLREVTMTELHANPPSNLAPDAEWDAGNLGCGDLVMQLRARLLGMKPGQILKLTATDPGAPQDLPAWCALTRHKLVFSNHPQYWIQRREN